MDQGGHDHGPDDRPPYHHRPHDPPYYDPDYDDPPSHLHEPPDNPRYPDPRIYGDYASKRPPRYVPHPFAHTCFKPRKDDYKPPVTCDDHDDHDTHLCIRKDHRTLTVDEQNRFLNASRKSTPWAPSEPAGRHPLERDPPDAPRRDRSDLVRMAGGESRTESGARGSRSRDPPEWWC